MNFILLQRDVASVYFGILGKQADRATLEYFAKKLHSGELSMISMANLFINAEDGQKRLAALNDTDKIQYIYHNTYGVNADAGQLAVLQAQLDGGASLGQLSSGLVSSLRSYEGNDMTLLSQQQTLENTINQSLFPSYTGNTAGYSGAADIQAIYYVLHSTMVSQGINFWGNKLDANPNEINKIADVFVDTRSYLTSLNDHDFVKRIFEETFKKTAAESDINKYLVGLQNHSTSRGDVVVTMINEIRSDTSSEHAAAKQQFLLATHVYKPGELPENKYLETVTALYYGVAGYTMDAAALDVYSKQLAAGMSTADLLRDLAKTPAFSEAVYWEQTYQQLFETTLDSFNKSKIWELSGKNAYIANSMVIDTFLNVGKGENDRGWVYYAKSYENIANALGYAKKAVLTINDSGKLVANINHQPEHSLSNIEFYALKNAEIQITHEANIPIYFAPNLEKIRITGDKKATLDFSKKADYTNIPTTITLENTHISFIGSRGDDRIFIASNADMINADAQFQMDKGSDWLIWQGNATAGTANIVSNHFKAAAALSDDQDNPPDNLLSANFLTKNIYLTTAADGKVNGKIESNINNFTFFQKIDLANYKGTGSIYLDGKLVATEGKNVFDFGVIKAVTSIHNTQYANVNHLTQPTPPPSSTYQKATGGAGLALTGFADNVTVINMPVDEWGMNYSFRTLTVFGDATANSRINFEYLDDGRYFRTTPVMSIVFNGSNSDKIDAGTLSFAIKHTVVHDDDIDKGIRIESSGSAENTLRLSGDKNAINTIGISGDKKLNLIIKSDFSTDLELIYTNMTKHGSLNLLAEKGGTGDGALYHLLSNSYAKYAAIRSELAGHQLNLSDSLESDTLNVQGNTTITRDVQHQVGGDTIIFKDSTINSMVTLKAVENWFPSTDPTLGKDDKIIVGDSANPWVFSTKGERTMTSYGDYTLSESNALFASLNVAPTATAFDVFSKALSVATHGASENQLGEVGVLKLEKNSFIIIDSNNNHSFDSHDIVFSLGNMATSDTLKLAHYTPPKVEISGAIAAPHELELAG